MKKIKKAKAVKKVKKSVKKAVKKAVKKTAPKKAMKKEQPSAGVIGAQAPGKDGIVYANALDKINASLSKPKPVEKTSKKKAERPVDEQVAVPEVKTIDVLGNIDKSLKKPEEPTKKAKAVNRKGTVVIEAAEDEEEAPKKSGKSVVMTGDGPKLVSDNGEEE